MDQVYLVLLGILAVIGLYIIPASFLTVGTAEAAVITRFGKFLRVAEPGLNWKSPIFDSVAGIVHLRALLLGSEEWLEKVLLRLAVHAVPGVFHDQTDIRSGSQIQARNRLVCKDFDPPRLDCQYPSFGHRIPRIGGEVQQNAAAYKEALPANSSIQVRRLLRHCYRRTHPAMDQPAGPGDRGDGESGKEIHHN